VTTNEKRAFTTFFFIFGTEIAETKALYSIFIKRVKEKGAVQQIIQKYRNFNHPLFTIEEIINNRKYYNIYIGKFNTKLNALNLSFELAHKFNRNFRVQKIQEEKKEKIKGKGIDLQIDEVAHGPFKPTVPNYPDSKKGTPKNRRVEVDLVSVKGGKREESFQLDKILKKGIYTATLKYWNLYPLPLTNATLFIKLKKEAVVLAGGVKVQGKGVKYRRRGDLLILYLGKFNPNSNPLPITIRFFAHRKFSFNSLPVYLIGQNPLTNRWIYRGDAELESVARRNFFKRKIEKGKIGHSTVSSKEVAILKKGIKYGIVSPDKNLTTADDSINLKIVVPLNSNFSLSVNGKEVSQTRIGEREKDKTLGIETIHYVAVPLAEGINRFQLKIGQKNYFRQVIYTTDIADIKFKLYPENPPADGKTPVYLIVQCVDDKGNIVPVSGFMRGEVDKGDIFDYPTGEFKRYPNDQFTIKLVHGKGIIKLSPAGDREERKVTVQFKGIKRVYRFSFVTEKRPWLITGIGEERFSKFENSKGKKWSRRKGFINFYGTGTVKNRYVVTLRYFSNPPKPDYSTSGEEGPGYHIYGDSSKLYKTAQSGKRLYLKVEEGKSYFLHGDYSTGFGKDLKFGKYDRKFTGEKLEIVKKDNYRLTTFYTLTHRDLVREEVRANGLSGPYFWHYNMVPESEKVWIEVRDRDNPDIIISRKNMSRFDDYEINYYQRYLIFRAPVSNFDKNLNPVYVVIQYEGDDNQLKKIIRGIAGEKSITDHLKFGGEIVEERSFLGKKNLGGVNFKYKKNGFKIKGEWAESINQYDLKRSLRGTARAIEMEYKNRAHQLAISYSYTQANSNFYNPTASVVNRGYRTRQFKLSKKVGNLEVVYRDKMDRNRQLISRKRSLDATYKLNRKATVTGGIVQRTRKGEGEYYQVTDGRYGVSLSPTNRLTLQYKREQTLKSNDGTNFRKTNRNGTYRLAQGIVLKVQNTKLIRNGTPTSSTTIALTSKLPGHTSAYAKYKIDDSISGREAKGLIGINKVFQIDKTTAISTGYEQGKVFKGNTSQNYKVMRFGIEWTREKDKKISVKYENRVEKGKKLKRLIQGGIIWKAREGLTLSVKERFFVSQFRLQDLAVGIAYRPSFNDKLNLLLKSRWTTSTKDAVSKKWLLLTNLNYQPNRWWEISGQTGVRFQKVEGVGTSYVEMVRGGVFRFIGNHWRVGGYGGIIRERIRDSYRIDLNPEVGYSPLPGIWLVGGVNYFHYFDHSFTAATYAQREYYFTIRVVFDEKALKFWKRILNGGFRQLFNPFWDYLDNDDFDDTFNDYY